MDSLKEKTSSPYLQKDISDLLPPNPYSYYQKTLTKREKIKRLRRSLEAGNIMGPACRDAFINPMTLSNWKKKSHLDRLSKLICAARDIGQGNRDQLVEDAQFRRLVSGDATSSEYEFYLCNRQPERWKKLKDNSIVVKTDVTVENNPSGNSNTFTGEDAEFTNSIRAKLFPEINT